MKVAVVGYGRMGKQIELSLQHAGVSDIVSIDPLVKEADYKEVNGESLKGVDVAIDFTYPDAVIPNCTQYCKHSVNVVMGTTGWYDKTETIKEMVSDTIGFIWSGNFSLGVNLYFRVIRAAAKIMGNFEQYDPLMYELHHNQKKDSPSGTAAMISKIVLEEIESKKKAVTGRLDRKIDSDEMHVASVRGGHIPGVHTVLFDSEVDTIEITHSARNREGFAKGSVQCAQWINGKKGFFTIDNYMDSLLK